MCVWDVLLGVWQNGGQVVVLGGAGYVLARARDAPGQVRSNDRRVEALSRDLLRWIHDRDRELTATRKIIEAYARNPDVEGPIVDQLVALRAPVPDELKQHRAGSQYHSGIHVRWQVREKEKALHQYRDRATETIDQLDSIKESEGRWHRIERERRGLAAPQVKVSSPELEILKRWRADVDLGGGLTGEVTDASRAEGEAKLRQLEADE
jgi:hypothetical protein